MDFELHSFGLQHNVPVLEPDSVRATYLWGPVWLWAEEQTLCYPLRGIAIRVQSVDEENNLRRKVVQMPTVLRSKP